MTSPRTQNHPNVGTTDAAALRRSARLHDLMFERHFAPLALIAPDHRFVRVNPAWAGQFKRNVEDFPGRTHADLFPGDESYIAERAQMLDRVVATKQPLVLRGRPFRFMDQPERGTTYWDWIIQPLHDERGEVELLFFIAHDATERVRTEQALQESERRFRSFFERSDAAMLLIEPGSGAIVDANLAATRFYGQSHERLCEMKIEDIYRLPPEEVAAERQRALREERNHFVFPHRVADGQVRTVEVHSTPVEVSGKSLPFSIVHDIAERQQMEKELQRSNDLLRAIIKSAPTAIFGLDLDGSVQHVWNPAAEKLLGWSADEVMGRPLPSVPVDSQEEFRRFRQKIRGGMTLNGVEVRWRKRDGTPIDYSIYASPLHDAEGRVTGNIAVLVDVTEHRRADEALRRSEELYKSFIAASPDGVGVIDAQGKVIFASQKIYDLLKLDGGKDDITGKDAMTWIAPEDRERATANLARVAQGTVVTNEEYRLVRHDGTSIYVEMNGSPLPGVNGKPGGIVTVVRDVTARRQALEALRRSEEHLRRVYENSPLAYQSLDEDGNFVDVNPAWCAMMRCAREEVIGKPFADFLAPEQRELFRERFSVFKASDGIYGVEFALVRRDGTRIEVELDGKTGRDAQGNFRQTYCILHDVTERKRAQRELTLMSVAMNNVHEAAYLIDRKNLQFVYVNDEACRMLGYTREELIGKGPEFIDPDYAKALESNPGQIPQRPPTNFQTGHRTRDGRIIPVEISLNGFEYDGTPYDMALTRDISERMRAERALERVNRALKTLISGNEALVRATSEQDLADSMCRVLVGIGGYRMAWIGLAEPDAGPALRPIARAGVGEGEACRRAFLAANAEGVADPTSMAMRNGEPQVIHDIAADPAFAHCREEAARHDFRSCIALPLREAARVIGALTIYAADRRAFNSDEVALLVELADDIAYGIHALRARRDREESTRRLQVAMETTIQALASTVELRDPYTAGHQQRVGKLAAAIARELGLSEHRSHGLYLAGVVHDIGKIQVPAELLSRPGRLTEIEYGLVKTHVRAGYEILRSVDFPWPIANTVYQHHERLDGSGYPNGLKGDEILLEARILAVSDVVEATSSHRPYRPALGIEAALAEIESGRGRLYDPQAVDACLKLFKEKGYSLD